MSSRLALVGLSLASAVLGGAASSYVAVAVAQSAAAAPAPAVPPLPATRFEHWCSHLAGPGLKLASDRGWELVAAYADLSGAKLLFSGNELGQFQATLPTLPTMYCFKRPAP
jgi:hypothetical protein